MSQKPAISVVTKRKLPTDSYSGNPNMDLQVHKTKPTSRSFLGIPISRIHQNSTVSLRIAKSGNVVMLITQFDR